MPSDLPRSRIFDKAAFYRGMAPRISHGLDHFPEDLDFSLENALPGFDIKSYFPMLDKEIRAYGLNMTITEKKSCLSALKIQIMPKQKKTSCPLIKDPASVSVWSGDFFKGMTENLKKKNKKAGTDVPALLFLSLKP